MTTTETRAIENTEDTLDVRDIIARHEYLEGRDDIERDDGSDDHQELVLLHALLDALKGNGGDEQWHGDWYPITLIRDSYFEEYAEEYAEELAVDIGAISPKDTWPLNCIDWEAAATQLQTDYAEVDFDGVTYWYR